MAMAAPVTTAGTGLFTAVVLGGSKNMTCDFFVQKWTNDAVCWRRNSIFAAFGFGYVGGVQYAIFNKLFPKMLPALYSATGPARCNKAVVAAVALDACVHMPFMYMPAFYVLREIAVRPELSLKESALKGLEHHRENFWQDATMQAAIFVPVQFFNFKYSPAHLRVPVVVTAGVLWMCVLSFARGDHDEFVTKKLGVTTGSRRTLGGTQTLVKAQLRQQKTVC